METIASIDKTAALRTKIATMTEADKETYVDAVYAEEHPSEEQLAVFFAVMLGGL